MHKDARSDSELNAVIDRWLYPAPRYHLRKRGMYWRPNSAGYTSDIQSAGIYGEEEAAQREHSRGQPDDVTMHRVPPANYCTSLDAVATAEDRLDTLAPATDPNAPRYKYSWALYRGVPPERQPFRATARQRAEALVSVIESLAPHEKV